MNIARSLGALLAVVIVVVFAYVFIPWITLGSINRLFDLNVEHGFFNYLYFWVIVFVFGNAHVSVSRS